MSIIILKTQDRFLDGFPRTLTVIWSAKCWSSVHSAYMELCFIEVNEVISDYIWGSGLENKHLSDRKVVSGTLKWNLMFRSTLIQILAKNVALRCSSFLIMESGRQGSNPSKIVVFHIWLGSTFLHSWENNSSSSVAWVN